MRGRCIVVFSLIILPITVLFMGQLAWVQVWRGDELRHRAKQRWLRRVTLASARGNIYSRNLRLLATSGITFSVWADPYTLSEAAKRVFGRKRLHQKDFDRLVRALFEVLKGVKGISYGRLLSRLRQKMRKRESDRPFLLRFVWLVRQLDRETLRPLEEHLKGPPTLEWRILRQGVGICPERKRFYPYGRFAAPVLGFVDRDGIGRYGVERDWDEELRGTHGVIEQETDALGRPLPESYHAYLPPRPGKSLILTLDEWIQGCAEKVIEEAMRRYRPQSALAIVLDPRTGDILAMASKPDFDPNDYSRFPPERFLNRALCFVYEPGSTIKPLIAAILLDKGLCTEKDLALCKGVWEFQETKIHCWVRRTHKKPHGQETLEEALRNSCNIAMAQFVLRLPYDVLLKSLGRFGLARRLGIRAGYEEEGWLDLPGSLSSPPLQLRHQLSLAYGHGIAVTPMQMAVAYSVFANQGQLVLPRIVKGIWDEEGEKESQVQWFPPRRVWQVISPLTAERVRKMLITAVEQGTGRLAHLNGVTVAGKTGTTMKITGHRYNPDRVIASFFGFLPADHPRWVIGIVLDDPKGFRWGGEVAAPLFAALGRQILRRVQPPRPLSQHLTAPFFFPSYLP